MFRLSTSEMPETAASPTLATIMVSAMPMVTASSLAPEMDPLRMGMGWTEEDLEKPQILVESTWGQPPARRICLNW